MSIRAFCRSVCLSETYVGTGYKVIDIDALSYIVQDYKVSADWLLTWRGGMFRKKRRVAN